MSTFVRFLETFALERAEREWNLVNANIVRLDNYDDILKLAGNLVFLLQPADCVRLNLPWKSIDDYKYPTKAFYIFGRDKYVDMNDITGLSEWVKLNGGNGKDGLIGDIIGLGGPRANQRNLTSYQAAKSVIIDMERKNAHSSSRKTD